MIKRTNRLSPKGSAVRISYLPFALIAHANTLSPARFQARPSDTLYGSMALQVLGSWFPVLPLPKILYVHRISDKIEVPLLSPLGRKVVDRTHSS